MNKQDRKEVESIINNLRVECERIQELYESEVEKFENMSEGLQSTERGQAIYDTAEMLDNIKSDIESSIDSLEELTI